MVAVPLYTAPGTPHPGYISTCPQACLVTPSPADGICHQNLLQLPPEEHVTVLHQDRRTNASSLPSRALQVAQRPHLVATSLRVEVSPALTEPTLYTTPPRAREVSNLHMHKTSNNRSYQSLYHHKYKLVYQNQNINQDIQIHNIPQWSKTSPGGNTMSGSPRKSTPA